MKKLTALISLILISLTIMVGCGTTTAGQERKTPMPNIYQKEDPAQDEILNLLMIGNSGCYYYVEELYGMLEAAGIKANVCNVYYNGCKLSQHWTWWKNKEAHYEYFITNENGRVKTEGVDLEWCLQQQNWDFISLQEGGMAALRSVSTEDAIQQRDGYLKDLFGYLREQFPKSRLLWNQSGAYQVGYTRSFVIASIEDQRKDNKILRDFSMAISQRYQVDWVPKGEAAMLVRETGYDNLCARLGKGENNEGDYYHDGDWGGGQFLTASVWFEILTGKSCIGNTYRPVYTYQGQEYTLSEEMVSLFQQSAHEAVAAISGQAATQ